MRKLSAGLVIIVASAFLNNAFARPAFMPSAFAQQTEANEENAKEDAQILYDEAVELNRQGNLAAAIDSYAKAMRLDRSILAFDDFGLIEALKKDCEEKLVKTPDDVKLLETLGFVFAVCYSDHASAIKCYEKVFELVTDERVKERTAALIERLRESEIAQSSYQQEVSAQLRDERLKTWSEMERLEKFGAETAAAQEKSSRLADAYKEKDSLKNKVPQLENELKELQEDYDKANRLWYSLKDDLYERRRRRLKDDIAAKQQELDSAKAELDEVESVTSSLERELSSVEKENEASPVRSYEENTVDDISGGHDYGSTVPQPPSNDYGSPDEEQPLPVVDNPDFPPSEGSVGGPGLEEEQNEDNSSKLEELIDNL